MFVQFFRLRSAGDAEIKSDFVHAPAPVPASASVCGGENETGLNGNVQTTGAGK
jgi:hypothetical protein